VPSGEGGPSTVLETQRATPSGEGGPSTVLETQAATPSGEGGPGKDGRPFLLEGGHGTGPRMLKKTLTPKKGRHGYQICKF
jgi:hypothetical protein